MQKAYAGMAMKILNLGKKNRIAAKNKSLI